MQLTSGMDVFAYVRGQKADTSSNYCENIQPYHETFQFFVKCDKILECFWEISLNF